MTATISDNNRVFGRNSNEQALVRISAQWPVDVRRARTIKRGAGRAGREPHDRHRHHTPPRGRFKRLMARTLAPVRLPPQNRIQLVTTESPGLEATDEEGPVAERMNPTAPLPGNHWVAISQGLIGRSYLLLAEIYLQLRPLL